MTDKAELLTETDMRNAYRKVSDKEWAIGGMEDARVFARAIEAAILRKLAEQPTVYIRRDQLQQAMAAPFLCDVGPAPRQDKVPLYAAPVPPKE